MQPIQGAPVSSVQRYTRDNMEERIGNIAAGALLDFFLEEIGPCIYNKAISDAQERMHACIMELDVDVYVEVFAYWRRRGRSREST